MSRVTTFILWGAINAFLAVSFGAFGAHAMKEKLGGDMMAVYQTAVQYHFYHALGLLLIGLAGLHFPYAKSITWSGRLMLVGIVLFSGSLYVLSVTGIRWLGAITPLGGLSFIGAWLIFAVGMLKAGTSQ